jgi:hypothetical protein
MAASKKPSLTAALQEASGRKTTSTDERMGSSELPAMPETSTIRDERSSRQGKKIISGHFDPAVSRQLKQLALDQNSNIQALLAEALNDLFIKHGRKPLA